MLFYKEILFYVLIVSVGGKPLPTMTGVHECPEGHKCIYKRGGAVLDRIEEPGYHWHEPLMTTSYPIQITEQTDKIQDVECGSSKGGSATLTIDVVNQLTDTRECIYRVVKNHGLEYDKPLIFDYVPSEVLQFCKNYELDEIYTKRFDELDEILLEKLRDNVKSYGLEKCLSIKRVRMERPKLSDEMKKSFERTESLKKQQEHAKEEAKTKDIKAKTELAMVESKAKQEQLTKKFQMDTKLREAENDAKIQEIENNKHKTKVLAEAQVEAEAKKLEAEANKKLHTPEYIQLQHFKAFYHNSKIHTGTSEMLKNSHNLLHTNIGSINYETTPPSKASNPIDPPHQKEYLI